MSIDSFTPGGADDVVVFDVLMEYWMLSRMSANTSDNVGGEDFREAARVALSFLRQSKAWLERRFGKFKYDPWAQDIDTHLFIPTVSSENCGGSIGAAFTGG